MIEAIPVDGLIGIGAFIASIIVLALIQGVSSAVASAQESRREAARLVSQLNALVSAVDRAGVGPKGPGVAQTPRPVRKPRGSGARRRSSVQAGAKPPYGPRSMARG